MSSQGPDYEHELNNGWSRWQNLVLSGLKELRDDQKELHTALNALTTKVALIEQGTASSQVSDLVDELEDRVGDLEKKSVTADALKRERRWWIGIALTALGSIAIPTIAVLISTAGLFG